MTRSPILTRFALSIVLAGAASAACAGGPAEDEAFQKRLFGHLLGPAESHACFNRVYDSSHLAHHPQQNVRTMLLLVTGGASDPSTPSYYLGLGVDFRKSGTHFETSGACGSIHDSAKPGEKSPTVHCGVDCDGGAIDVSLRDATSVLVSIPEGARIWKAGSDDAAPPGSERKRFGADDKLFRLDKTALTNCLPLVADEKVKAALRKGQ